MLANVYDKNIHNKSYNTTEYEFVFQCYHLYKDGVFLHMGSYEIFYLADDIRLSHNNITAGWIVLFINLIRYFKGCSVVCIDMAQFYAFKSLWYFVFYLRSFV